MPSDTLLSLKARKLKAEALLRECLACPIVHSRTYPFSKCLLSTYTKSFFGVKLSNTVPALKKLTQSKTGG